MAVMNVTAGQKAVLTLGNTAPLAVPGVSNGLEVPFMQDITVNASTGVVRYKTLDSSSEKAFTTPSTNQISLNCLVDEDVFFGASNTTNKIANDGLFGTQNDKTTVFFSVAFEGTGSGSTYLKGSGFLSGLAPTASQDAAVFITPVTIEVDGDLTKATV
tara:strand:+ start:4222 stop:4698 length:477 start_codon:yes stop_codon:yes gene_type:complete